jgi:hypothetical protein
MNRLKSYAYLWIFGVILLGYALLNLGSSSALDINLHDTYFVNNSNFLAITLAVIGLVLGFVLWTINRKNRKRSINYRAKTKK